MLSMYGLLPIARILRCGNQRIKVALASVIIIPSDPLTEFVFPIHAFLVFAKLEVLIPRQVWGGDCFIQATHKNYINIKFSLCPGHCGLLMAVHQ